MDILKRPLAPIVDKAWALIEEEAVRTLKAHLAARYVVDLVGPLGWETSAVSLGRLDVSKDELLPGVGYGIRRVQPLVELRVPFELDVWELDNAARGAEDIELGPVVEAARRIAACEDKAIFDGLDAACIRGLARSVPHEPIPFGADAASDLEAVVRAVLKLRQSSVEGPYALVLGPDLYRRVESAVDPYPPIKRIERIIEGPVLLGPTLDGNGYLISRRGGDFELTVGQDIAIGYETHDAQRVRLFLTESFTFRVLEPAAAVRLIAG